MPRTTWPKPGPGHPGHPGHPGQLGWTLDQARSYGVLSLPVTTEPVATNGFEDHTTIPTSTGVHQRFTMSMGLNLRRATLARRYRL